MSLTLTPKELLELTDDATPAGQRAWLNARGWVFETGKRGRPKVDREYYRERMGAKPAEAKEWRPDFSDLPAG